MTEPAIRLDEMQAAMATPTWRLLEQKWAHVILTVLAEAQDRLRLHFDIIEQHPFEEQLLNDRERAELRRTMHMITDSVAAVLDQRDAMTSSLVKHITSRNPLREKELDKAIREAQIRLRQ
jgi:hypothetical protein